MTRRTTLTQKKVQLSEAIEKPKQRMDSSVSHPSTRARDFQVIYSFLKEILTFLFRSRRMGLRFGI